MSVRIAFRTTGCRVNQADTERVRAALSGLPVVFVPPGRAADVVVVNACTVTAPAERDGRQAVRQAVRTGAPVVVLAGCMATRLARDGAVASVPEGVRVVAGTFDRTALVELLSTEVVRLDAAGAGVANPGPAEGPAFVHRGRARPLVKVQDGCDCRCSYCIVPHVRGASRSEPLDRVRETIAAVAAGGAAEAVLAGVDLASWGRDLPGAPCLADLLGAVTGLGTGLRFRLSSVEPHGLDARLVDAIASNPDVCPYFHVPAQSGSDRVLSAMGRPYGASALAKTLGYAVDRIPDAGLGLDLIVGFPGETADDFEATRALVASLPVVRLHVFPFSPRPGTAAAGLPDDVPLAVKEARAATLRAIAEAGRSARLDALAGREIEVVDVRTRAGGQIESVAADGTRVVRTDSSGPRSGRFRVRVTGREDALFVTAVLS